MASIWGFLFGWLPPFAQLILLGVFAILTVLLVLRIVKIILDALPFV